jgi:hypothetical protein
MRGGRGRGAQRGAMLLLLAAALAAGAAWFAVETLARLASTAAEREARTGVALARAKQALLAYVAHYAARSDHQVPGRLPCPEPLSPPAGQEGIAASLTCNNNALTYVGRLPWRTLGIDQLRDGHGEPLWYVLGPGFRAPPINFDSTGRLTLDGIGGAAVALVIAPGAPVDSLLDPQAPPPGCARTSQSTLRYPVPFSAFDPRQFLECGNTGGNYSSAGDPRWFNDRALPLTAGELMAAIAGPVLDRLQRVVAPAIASWDQAEDAATGRSWGASHASPYLPFAGAFANPATHGFCGEAGVREGLLPIASRASSACDTGWNGSATLVSGLIDLGCDRSSGELRCSFRATGSAAPPAARVGASAPNVAASFRGTIAAADVSASHGGGVALSLSLSAATASANAVVDVAWPAPVAAGEILTIALPHLPDARLLSDPRLAWFFNNQWPRHLYYAVASGATAGAASPCDASSGSGCLAVHGLPSSTGVASDKHLVLALMGPALPGQSRSCAADANGNATADCDEPAQYLEAENASAGDGIFRADLRVPHPAPAPWPWPPFNDRVAACPLHYLRHNGTATRICG